MELLQWQRKRVNMVEAKDVIPPEAQRRIGERRDRELLEIFKRMPDTSKDPDAIWKELGYKNYSITWVIDNWSRNFDTTFNQYDHDIEEMRNECKRWGVSLGKFNTTCKVKDGKRTYTSLIHRELKSKCG